MADGWDVCVDTSEGLYSTYVVWHAKAGEALLTYNGHAPTLDIGSSVISVVWSPDSKRVASGCIDASAQIWGALD
ncbi:MAG TPA: hypothetical protein VGD98_14560 [Ktedonobacteraceae bacterium]